MSEPSAEDVLRAAVAEATRLLTGALRSARCDPDDPLVHAIAEARARLIAARHHPAVWREDVP